MKYKVNWDEYENYEGLFNTEKEALADAERIIRDEGCLDDGWHPGIYSLSITKDGETIYHAKKCNVTYRPSDDELDEYGNDCNGEDWSDPDWDCKFNYKMVRVEQDN